MIVNWSNDKNFDFSAIDIHKAIKQKDVSSVKNDISLNIKELGAQTVSSKLDSDKNLVNQTALLDVRTWLPFASKKYEISPNIEDYIVTPVITITSDVSNRNGVGFALSDLVKFNPDMGMQAYKTFKAKPTHVEHENKDITKAKGVILDTFLRKIPGKSGCYKLLELLAFDRTKDEALAKAILNKQINSYSMGAHVENFRCSYCGALHGDCDHLSKDPSDINFYVYNGVLVYAQCVNPIGFETSAVGVGAYSMAVADKTFSMGLGE